MGNGVGLPYDILDAVDYQSNNHWQLNKGSQKVWDSSCTLYSEM